MAAHLDSIGLAEAPERWRQRTGASRVLEVAIVNNMPDSALIATERQFTGLVESTATGPLRVSLYYLPEISRGADAQAVIGARYHPVEQLYRRPVDALIVTGNEPRAKHLADEPYWPALTRLADWAKDHTVSTIWSCLAGHGAVLHLDGVERHPLDVKRSGAFTSYPSPYSGLPAKLQICHSRLNEVRGSELRAKGYEVLSENTDGQVCIFAKTFRSRFVFFQGHPEYETDSLLKEYRRDVSRYLRSERKAYPEMPENYFNATTAQRMDLFRAGAELARDPDLMKDFPRASLRDGLALRLEAAAGAVFANWIVSVANRKAVF